MRVCMRLCIIFMLCLDLPASIQTTFWNHSINVQQNTQVTESPQLLKFQCCVLLEHLTRHLVRSGADKVKEQSCMESACHQLKLINSFITHTNSMLQSDTFPEIVQSSDNLIQINTEILPNHYTDLLVLAFLGRSVYYDRTLRDLSMEYEQGTDTLRIRESSCNTDKSIYSTIIGASIALLIFFIASQVVIDDTSEEVDQQTGTKYISTQASTKLRSAIGLRVAF